MGYRIGFFVQTVSGYSSHPYRLILRFIENHFEFQRIDFALNPKVQEYGRGWPVFIGEPVVFFEDSDGTISNTTSFSAIPIRERKEIENNGLEFLVPSINEVSPLLLFNGQIAIPCLEEGNKEQLFTSSLVLYHIIDTFYTNTFKTEAPDQCLKACKDAVRRFHHYIDNINLYAELATLKVVISDYLRTKVGDDDTYYVYRDASISSSIINSDTYLRQLVDIGHSELAKESGYTNHLEKYTWDILSKEGYVLGELKEDSLEKEKQRILARYSFDEHLAQLLYEGYQEEKRKQFISKKLIERLPEYKNAIMSQFHLDDIRINDDWRKKLRQWGVPNYDSERILSEMNEILKRITTVS